MNKVLSVCIRASTTSLLWSNVLVYTRAQADRQWRADSRHRERGFLNLLSVCAVWLRKAFIISLISYFPLRVLTPNPPRWLTLSEWRVPSSKIPFVRHVCVSTGIHGKTAVCFYSPRYWVKYLVWNWDNDFIGVDNVEKKGSFYIENGDTPSINLGRLGVFNVHSREITRKVAVIC